MADFSKLVYNVIFIRGQNRLGLERFRPKRLGAEKLKPVVQEELKVIILQLPGVTI
jgi:hypothetical protein